MLGTRRLADHDVSERSIVTRFNIVSQSLEQMAARARVVLNCVGPYSVYGEPVVQACLNQSTSCLDVSGEPFYLESVHVKFDKAAAARNVQIIGSCGFDSVPADVGIQALLRKSNQINRIETYLRIEREQGTSFRGNYATWESLVNGFGNYDKLRQLRQQGRYATNFRVNSSKPLRKDSKYYTLPFPGSDRSVVARTLHANGQQLGHLDTWFQSESLPQVCGLVFGAVSCKMLSGSDFGRKLLLNRSNMFSLGVFNKKKQPNIEDLKRTHFSLSICGYDKNDKLIHELLVTGPDPGYHSAAIASVECAKQLISQNDTRAGVFTPGSFFNCDQLTARLDAAGIKFTFVK